jgi:glucose/arabinose dehydrogenase
MPQQIHHILGAALLLLAPPAVADQHEVADQKIGAHFEIRPADLPAPAEDTSVGNSSETVPRPAGALPQVPPGFEVSVFAEGFAHARNLLVLPNGDVLLAEIRRGWAQALRDETGAGKATKRFTFASGLNQPHGLAFHDGYVYVADVRGVWRYRWNAEDGTAGPVEQVTPNGALGQFNNGHPTRNIAFAPDGKHFYVSVGSTGNVDEEPAPFAAIKEFDADGSNGKIFASGLRNPVDLHFYPGSYTLWTVVNERDGLGDGLVPDYLTSVQENGFYGWPYAYIGQHKQPGPLGEKHPELAARAIVPDLLLQSHSAPLGLDFYEGGQFPAEYRGDAFVALHGSWNSSAPTGYKIVRVRFKDGRPVGGYENFMTGFWLPDTNPAQVWGRPVGLATAKDGSLLVADDVGQRIWRIRWVGK